MAKNILLYCLFLLWLLLGMGLKIINWEKIDMAPRLLVTFLLSIRMYLFLASYCLTNFLASFSFLCILS